VREVPSCHLLLIAATAMEKNRGKPKKGGAGKANWGKPGDELYGHALHPNDPLYDSLEVHMD